MKVKVLNTLKSGSDIIPAGQILTDDEIPAFIVKLVETESEHIAILPDDVVVEEQEPEGEKEPEGEGKSEDSAEDEKESVEDHSEEASTEEKTPKKRK